MPRLVLVLTLVLTACNPGRRHPPSVAAVESATDPHALSADADREAAVQQLLENFQRVHFALDSSSLTDDAKAALTANAAILGDHPDLRVEVQGHADERGTVDYNLALGQRRAKRVTDWLTSQGVPTGRLRTVSYGEELPLVSGRDERAWSKNRRAEFRITAGSSAVVGTTE